jgi:hypothetical protein
MDEADLLTALQSLLWYVGQLEAIVYSADDKAEHEEVTKARAAIAKATGHATAPGLLDAAELLSIRLCELEADELLADHDCGEAGCPVVGVKDAAAELRVVIAKAKGEQQ